MTLKNRVDSTGVDLLADEIQLCITGVNSILAYIKITKQCKIV